MKTYHIITLSAALFSALYASGRPAHTGTRAFIQPDGTEISLRLIGDEHSSITVTADEHALPLVREGQTYYFATLSDTGSLVSTGLKAVPYQQLSTEQRQLLFSQSSDDILRTLANRSTKANRIGTLTDNVTVPNTGNVKCLAVLVNYTDVKFTISNPNEYYTAILNAPDVSSYNTNAVGSVNSYFVKQSYGAFSPEFDVYGPITLAHNRAYYGTNNSYGSDQAAHEMALEAAAQLYAQGVDLKQYDNDGNGEVDNILVIYAGETAAVAGNPTEYVWPHSWNISYGGISEANRTFGSTKVDHYICANELVGGLNDGVGTIVHEFSHALGLPDLYSTDTSNMHYNTPCWWSVMDIGCDLGNGWTPPLYSTYERYALGWANPLEMSEKKFYLLTSMSQDGRSLMVSNPDNENEKYFFEYRTLTGWDANISAAGVLIWRLRYEEEAFASNGPNNDPSRMLIDLIEANRTTPVTSANVSDFSYFYSDPWPQGSVNSFTSTTSPAFLTDEGKPFCHNDGTENRIINITTGISGKAGLGAYSTPNRPANHLDVGKHEIYNAISGVTADNNDASYTLCGHKLTVTANTATQAMVCTPTGAVVTICRVAPDQPAVITLPSKGIYLLRTGNTAAKILVR